MELVTEKVFIVEKKQREGARVRVLRYGLFCDRTAHGGSFFYIKAHSQLWEGAILVRESFEATGGLGRSRPQAMQVFARLCEARRPILPEHLPEVVRDITYSAAARGRATVGARRPRRAAARPRRARPGRKGTPGAARVAGPDHHRQPGRGRRLRSSADGRVLYLPNCKVAPLEDRAAQPAIPSEGESGRPGT